MSKFIENKYNFSDVLIRPAQNTSLKSRADAKIQRDFVFNNGQTMSCIPIMNANMDYVGDFSVAQVLLNLGAVATIRKNYDLDELIDFFKKNEGKPLFYTLGLSEDDYQKFVNFVNKYKKPDYVCMDVANGGMSLFSSKLATMRDFLPSSCIMAGNVATPEQAYYLYKAGADIVKVGIGPGSVCTTRKVTGVGYPQLSAIYDIYKEVSNRRSNAYICADGGLNEIGDFAKAFVAGADFTMSGSWFAGTNEAGSVYHGMASYQANPNAADYRTDEGKEVILTQRYGSVESRFQALTGGIRSAMSYTGKRRIKDLRDAEFVVSSQQENKLFSGGPFSNRT